MPVPFLKKILPPGLNIRFLAGKPKKIVGVDIGAYSTKVVQLRYEAERAVLETYGELLTAGYLKNAGGAGTGFLRFLDNDIAEILKDIFRESKMSARDAVFAIPATSGFTVTIPFPKISRGEIQDAIPLEARKYVPIPLTEVMLDWVILENDEQRDMIEVFLIAVPKEVIEKFRRIAELTGIRLHALEIETFSAVRSLIGNDATTTMVINFGHQSTTVSIVDRGIVRLSHNFNRGSQQLTRAIEQSLGISRDRAETMKREMGLSEKVEEREITSVIAPLVETLLADVNRIMKNYNHTTSRKIQRIDFTGGGSQLQGIVELAASRFGVEVTRGNPFSRIVTPPFIQPMLQEISPSFSVAIGLALYDITSR